MRTMTDFDPIHTVYNHLSGRQPVALMVSDCPTAVFLHRAGNRVTTWIVPSSQPTMIVHLPNLVFHGWCCLLVLTGSVQHFFPPPPPFPKYLDSYFGLVFTSYNWHNLSFGCLFMKSFNFCYSPLSDTWWLAKESCSNGGQSTPSAPKE